MSDYDSEGEFKWLKWEIEGNEDTAYKGCTATMHHETSPRLLVAVGLCFTRYFSKELTLNLDATYKYTLNLDFMHKEKVTI